MVKQNTGGCSYERSYRYYFRKRRRRQNDNLSERRHRACHAWQTGGSHRHRYRSEKPGCRHGTGKPDYLQSGRCDRGKLPDEAGADSRQKIS